MIDVAGIGKSGKSRIDYNFHSLAKDVKAVIDKKHLKKCVLLGHAMGGIVALETAIILKKQILGLIIAESLSPLSDYYARKVPEKEISQIMKDYEGNYQNYYDNLLRKMFGNKVSSELVEWYISVAGYGQFDSKILRKMVRNMLLYDYHDYIDLVSCPIKYIIQGLYSPEYLAIITREQKNARIMKNIGHLVNVEDPEKFNQIVDEYMQELVKIKNQQILE